jgi:aspartate/methionine/tyrosine aminotransferase
MPSHRLPSDLTLNAAARTLEALRRRGIAVLDLTNSNPTRAALRYPGHMLEALASPAALVYEPQPFGMTSAREAVAEDFRRRGLEVSPARIVLTASTSEAYAWLFKLLCDPGDNVLVPRPSYPLFEHLALLESIEARPYRLDFHGEWRVDLDALRRALDERTRAVLSVSPNNPTGSFLHADDLAALASLCEERGMMLVGDEVFADFPLASSRRFVSVLAHDGPVVCSLGGLSKSVGLPQIKVGWMAFAGPQARLDPLMSACELIADTYLSVSTPAQIALPSLLREGEVVRRQIQERTTTNYAVLQDLVAGVPEVSVLPADGGWSAVLRVPAYRSEESLVLELLTSDHVLVHPGFFFDFEREAFLVVSLLPPPEQFAEGIRRVLARAARPGSGA